MKSNNLSLTGAGLLSNKFSHITKPECLRKESAEYSVSVHVCLWDLLFLDLWSPQSKLTHSDTSWQDPPPSLCVFRSHPLSINYHLSRLSVHHLPQLQWTHSLKMLIFNPPFFLMSYLSLGLCVCVLGKQGVCPHHSVKEKQLVSIISIPSRNWGPFSDLHSGNWTPDTADWLCFH